ncbi:hypothetical protein [Alteromonas sp.]|uniref:hypothetical protein n=1 Tax=Alteromonas sp. TaxID=232 RepID=UPI000C54A195|nr:hypothetical protein [Alteromonas sp.]MAI39206.1 hypothetical protein [Alteromonas sp.]|tara:strand:+ start:186 stop:983 length:798 start_codon:yes stop_codon:yes gene_type:complete
MEDNLAKVIHITGTQRSGHSFIGIILTANEGLTWWKQHDEEPWVLKASMESTWQSTHPSLQFIKILNNEYQEISMKNWFTYDRPVCDINFGSQTVNGVRAIRVTEYQHPKWYDLHVSGHVSSSAETINVVRDPRNVLASAIGKGWSQSHCEELMAACEYQHINEQIKSCTNVSYEQIVRHLNDDSKEKFIGGIKLNDWALPTIRNLQAHQGNSSFQHVTNNEEYFERYKRPDIVASPIFQSLISKAEEVHSMYHIPFLESINVNV